LERKKFGPLGWNVGYDWIISDFKISQIQLKIYCEQSEEIPFKALNVLLGTINYGGRVSDDQDFKLIESLVEELINPAVLSQGN
jgi:dynein heavy chain, axonemal